MCTARPNHQSVYRLARYGPSRRPSQGAIVKQCRTGHVQPVDTASSLPAKGQPHGCRPSAYSLGRRGATGRCGFRATDQRPWSVAAPDVFRSVHHRLRGDVSRLPDFRSLQPGSGRSDRIAAGARLHCSARLRPRLVLHLEARQCDCRPGVQSRHDDALCQLGPPTQPASRQLVQPRPAQGSRPVFGLPDRARLSSSVAVATSSS